MGRERRRSFVVRPRLVWAGVGGACLGMSLVAWGVATGSWVRVGAGVAVLLAGCVCGLVGGALHDTRRPDRLVEEARAAVHGSTRHVVLHAGPSARQAQSAREADRTRRTLLSATAGTPANPLAPLAAFVLVTEGILLMAAQGDLYPMSHAGQVGSERILGAGIVFTLGGVRVLMGRPGRHLPTVALVLTAAVALFAGGVLLDHQSDTAPWVESFAGLLAALAALVCFFSPHAARRDAAQGTMPKRSEARPQ